MINTNNPIRAAVIGLGQIGSRFDEESGRKVIWSHVGAYLGLTQEFELCGASDFDSNNILAFKSRCPNVPVYSNVSELIKNERPDVISICTPTTTHFEIFQEIRALSNSYIPKVIWCEKPLATTLDDAKTMVSDCEKLDIKLIVSYNRRWLPIWKKAMYKMENNLIGDINTIRISMPNRLFSIGSHAVDLANFLGGPIEKVTSLNIPKLYEENEPAKAVLLLFKSGVVGSIEVTGFKENLVVEAEVYGSAGRLKINEVSNEIIHELFEESDTYKGYKILKNHSTEIISNNNNFSVFIEIAKEIMTMMNNENFKCTCDGFQAMATQEILKEIAN
ncbi:MAG: Gfo/Idh/MocA family oxidoreductase [Methylocystaceae bacterium]|nr:Gfo/Idh/MocA family oxidoreductase [Methylocystaceae bacterium]